MQKSYEVTGAFVADARDVAFTLSKSYVAGNKGEAIEFFREDASAIPFGVPVRPGRITVAKGEKVESEVEFAEMTEEEHDEYIQNLQEQDEDEELHAKIAEFEEEVRVD